MNKKPLCDVVFPIPSFNTYTYYIPDNIKIGSMSIVGSRVLVDFGKQKNKIGVIVNLRDKLEISAELKPIKSLVDIIPLFDKEQLDSAKRFSDIYVYPFGMMLNLFFNIEKKCIFQQAVLLNKKISINIDNREFSKNFLKIINNKKKELLYVPSDIKEKFEFYKESILYSVSNNKKLIILFPSIEFISDFWNYLNNNWNFELEILNTKIAKYSGEIDIQERYKIWYFFRNNQINVVLASKIGCFLPFNDLWSIIIDEPDSLGYKNPEAPMYDTKFIVSHRIKNFNSKIIYCTFIPSINLKYKQKQVIISENSVLKKNNFKIYIAKKELKDIVTKNIYKFKQTIIFLPYRGYRKFYICMLCKKLIPINKVKDKFVCPYCNGKYYKEYGMNAKKFIEFLKSLDKNITIEYLDAEMKLDKISNIINEFNNEKIDVLVTTFVIMDYIYKLKFSNVQSIYFSYLDSILSRPDYTSYERIYRVIKTMESVLNSHSLVNVEIFLEILNRERQNDILLKDYNTFYRKELKIRKELSYPPFSDIIKIGIKDKNQSTIKKVVEEITKSFSSLDIEMFSFDDIEKVNKEYEYNLLVKITKKNKDTLNKLRSILKQTIEKNYKTKIYLEYEFIED